MPGYHELAELAPRDVVARAIHRELETAKAEVPMVYLDVTHLDAEKLKLRFPRIYQTCKQYGLDITRDLIPIRPAAHYAMGGVRTDLEGRTSLPGLYAAGEAACTRVHGGNRLASNSLLEGLVFGARAARGMVAESVPAKLGAVQTPAVEFVLQGDGDEQALQRETQQLMEDNVGIIRDADRLSLAVRRLREILAALPAPSNRRRAEARNIAENGLAIASSALARRESRGGHYRSDYPARDDANFLKHSVLQAGVVRFE
jgi:L-aspartate oxidase